MAELLDELIDFLRIPSVSTGTPAHPGGPESRALAEAAAWVRERIETAGGQAEALQTERHPLVVGELRSKREAAATLLVYGHYDVQDPGPPEAWITPPFEPTIRDGRLYARGAADDKGNFLPLLHAACALARAGELPVHVRFLVEGEEESGGESAADWIRADERGADCALVFDSLMVDERTPAITIASRGAVFANVEVRTGVRDLHSGLYGGAVLNAANVLARMLAEVLPNQDGRVRDELRAGVAEPTSSERETWALLASGEQVIASIGGREVAPGAGAALYERTGADTALDVNHIAVGEPRAVVPAQARATVSVRTAPGQRSAEIAAELERLLRSAAPEGAEVAIEMDVAEPALIDTDHPALGLAAKAFERACGRPPALIRLGGTLPVLAAFAERGIVTVFSGFALDDDAFHAPNESFRLEALEMGERSAHELYAALAQL